MIEALQDNKKIIINSDLDGIISGILLTNFMGCEVVGFSNSGDTVWIDKNRTESIYEPVYIDMFVSDDRVTSIDQHIVSVNQEHHRDLLGSPNKFNPNLENPRFHLPNESYFKKFPLGTLQYLVASLEGQGVDFDFDLMHKRPGKKIGFVDLLYRSDDALYTTVASNYRANALQWWSWLKERSNNGKLTNAMFDAIESFDRFGAIRKKEEMSKMLRMPPFSCDTSDGGYKEVLNSDGTLRPCIPLYCKSIAASANLNCFDMDLELTPFKGQAKRSRLSEAQRRELIDSSTVNGEKVFSYAFVKTSYKEDNFSYTVMPDFS